ncbi:zinc finger BED domain-containing protein RICESLEEPER 1-like [Camellia sinensis]|uniref:zinc finger BED domain-containing protein RICESLEEPER 1-like n=1 Tax=Camellia sinensis TaxID=4442 RepID=UPI0010355561|nr:zinc finger BED domain-containing protein RICESLEEPER 1-like [Camellia sinensis]XP_028117193.1 zinc finger BED domain-containing protein RICESLEEPER 1-like [Camellia sinensis]XP_028117198.1 zinc finger BED domain-containing protein RICESLEEPER 1-like [Camellia sinensis]XP_028117204.1 zinc finger BED domain-containing protein RICESLEEPER 1-like [Camellia sinensis]
MKFLRSVLRNKKLCRKVLCLDVPTRWNSTYLMLEAAEKAFERLEDEDSNYRAYFKVCEGEDGDGQVFGDEDENEDGDRENGRKKSRRSPTARDWNNCRIFLKFLKLFYNATKRFSGSLFVTSNYFFDEMFVIQTKIEQLIKKDDKLLSTMAQNMKEKFEKYWGNGEKINLLVYVAVLLDPWKQLRYLKFCFAQLLVERVVNEMTGRVKDCLSRLYEHYASHDSVTVEMFNVCEGSAMKVDDDCDDPHL